MKGTHEAGLPSATKQCVMAEFSISLLPLQETPIIALKPSSLEA